MQNASDFISAFIRDQLKNLVEEEELRSALSGVVGLNRDNLHESVVRKLIAALRKKKCKVDTPRNRDPFEVLVAWIAAALITPASGSGAVNNSSHEQNANGTQPKGKRKSGRQKRARSTDSEDEPPPANSGSAPSSSSKDAPPNGDALLPPLATAADTGGQGANAGQGLHAPLATPIPALPLNPQESNSGITNKEASPQDLNSAGKNVVFDQNTYVSLMGLVDRLNSQYDALAAEQKRTQDLLVKQQAAASAKPSPTPKRGRKASSPKPDPKSLSPRSQDSLMSPTTRADVSELDKFLAEPFDDGGIDNESRELEGALNDFSKSVNRDDDDVLIVSDPDASFDDSEEERARPKRDRKRHEEHLKFNGLRPKSERARAITHQNGFPEAIKWLRSKGISLARFVAGHEVQMKPRDKQELEVLSSTLLSLVDQVQPGMVVQLDAADILIRRIMSLCLRDKLDDDYLEVLSNPSGSHLAPLEWLTEANKVYKIVKKAKDSQSSSAKTPLPTPRWRNQQQHLRHSGHRAQGRNSTDKSGAQPKRVSASKQTQRQSRNGQRERNDGGRGAGTDASSSSNNN